MKLLLTILFAISTICASASPVLQAVPCDGYKDAYEYARKDIEVIAVGSGFCIVRYDESETAPVKKAGSVELGSANRDIYILESYRGEEWQDKPGTELLARFGDSYIVAVEPHLLTTNWAGQFEIRKVFNRPIQPPKITQDYPPIEENRLVREMVNRLYARDFGYYLEGLVDETPSRYTYSPKIKPATDYIERQFESAGLDTERHNYNIEAGSTPSFNNIYWMDDLRAEAVDLWGNNFVTNDGGVSWQEIVPEYDFKEVSFFDAKNGIAVDMNCNLFKTTNGGTTWDFFISVADDWLVDASFRDSDNWAFLARDGYYSITSNGGQTWTKGYVNITASFYGGICYSSDNDIWISYQDSDDDLYIYYSENGGLNFSEIIHSGIPSSKHLSKIIMYNNSKGIIYRHGYGSSIYFTNDGCETWSESSGSGSNCSVVEFVGNMKGLAFEHNGGYVTYDGGENWAEMGLDFSGVVQAIAVKNENEYWVAGSPAIIAKTTDGGEIWETVEVEWSEDDFVSENVIAEIRGKTTPEQIYIVCAHYDSISGNVWYSAPGAEDNGSGTAGVLQLAKIMAQYEFASTIRFCAWSGEEEGLLGSEAYAAEAFDRGDDIRAVYNMDMIAYMNDENYDTTIAYDDSLDDILFACQEASDIYVPELQLYPEEGWSASDHSSFWNYGYPAIMAIEYAETRDDFYPWYHTTHDTYDRLQYDYGILNVKLGAALIGSLAEPLSGPTFAANDVYAYPNPARPETSIVSFANVPEGAEIEIYTISGDKVATVYERNLDAHWDLCNNLGDEVASGVYLYRLDIASGKKIGKIAVLK